MTDFKKALFDPSGCYEYPKDVLADDSLSDEQKHQILKQWEYDARELMVADEENMAGDSANFLQRVEHALYSLQQKMQKK